MSGKAPRLGPPPSAEDKEALRASFERFSRAHAATEPPWLRERRTAAFARYVEKGAPSTRDEAWRHTPVAPLVRTRFEPADPRARPTPEVLSLLPRDGMSGTQIVFTNGRLAPELSRLDAANGVVVSSLREALAFDPSTVEPWLGRVTKDRGGVFTDLNAAFFEDGAVVWIAPDTQVSDPIHVVHLAAPNGVPAVAHVRSLILAGQGSESRLVETFLGPDGRPYLVNALCEVALEDGARVGHTKLQREGNAGLHVATLAVRLGRDARFSDHAVSLGASLARNDIDVFFGGEGGECVLDGLFAVDGERVTDTHSRVEHASAHCSSRQLYKGVLDQGGRGVFHGLVRVAPGAQKTDAVQTNRNLLLSRQALVHSTPQLEILADDVKCRHGSTTGQLDLDALFYLRSRGIGEPAARGLLTWAFAADVLGGIEVAAVRQAATRLLLKQLSDLAPSQEALW